MARYAVGDLQGHLDPLQKLLEQVRFDPANDELWLVGDLVNRGQQNADILRFLSQLPHCHVTLGNHDLHLLAVAHSVRPPRSKDTFVDILGAPDRDQLLHWLQTRPLLHRCERTQKVMTHAGIPPCWSITKASELAQEVEQVLADTERAPAFFAAMYGNQPDQWDDSLSGEARWRCITNYFTRMRFITDDSRLDFDHKESPDTPPDGWTPWYQLRQPDGWQVIFGHWAALMGNTGRDDMIALDTGYGWGNWLTLRDIDSGQAWRCDAA